MIISYKFIFIRIPKTASTSIENFCKMLDSDCIKSDTSKPPYGHKEASRVKKKWLHKNNGMDILNFVLYENQIVG